MEEKIRYIADRLRLDWREAALQPFRAIFPTTISPRDTPSLIVCHFWDLGWRMAQRPLMHPLQAVFERLLASHHYAFCKPEIAADAD